MIGAVRCCNAAELECSNCVSSRPLSVGGFDRCDHSRSQSAEFE